MNSGRYTVVFSPIAREEALDAARYIAKDSMQNALKWYDGLEKLIGSLSQFPRRFGAAREADAFDIELRQVVYRSHRIIFTIEEQTVTVLHVRHGAQSSLR
ncbi:MAG: type II toxin-antitoxin system RelE/ParE family toxin [Tepidisphaeraceae bacterium]